MPGTSLVIGGAPLNVGRAALLEKGAAVLVNAFAFGGHNATLAFSAFTARNAS